MDRYYTTIEKSFIYLIENFNISSSIDTLIDVLLDNEYINNHEWEVISNKNISRIKMAKLILVLLMNGTGNYRHLYDILITEIAKTRQDVAEHLQVTLDNTQESSQGLIDISTTFGQSYTLQIAQMVKLMSMLLQNRDNLDIFSVVCEEFKKELEWTQVGEMLSKLQLSSVSSATTEVPQCNHTEIVQTACREGYTDIVELILQIGNMDINAKNGQPPLILAIQNKNANIVGLLMGDEHVNVNIESVGGATGLAIACQLGYTDIAQTLLGHSNICVNIMSRDGLTPLMMASECGHVDVVRLLLSAEGINVNIQNEFGATALLMACHAGHERVVQMLMENGAVVNRRVLRVARRARNQAIINLVS